MTSYLRSTKFRLATILIAGTLGTMMLLYGGAFEADAVTDGQTHGTVISVITPTLMIETAPDYDTMSFRVESTTKISKDGRKVGLEEVVSGDSVIIVSKTKDDERIATTVLAKTPY